MGVNIRKQFQMMGEILLRNNEAYNLKQESLDLT
jgi:hypothetical protein